MKELDHLVPFIFQCREGETDEKYVFHVEKDAQTFLDIDVSVIIFPFDENMSTSLEVIYHTAKLFATNIGTPDGGFSLGVTLSEICHHPFWVG
jgi:hypothetical protein